MHLAPEHWKSIRPFLGHRRVEDAVTNPPYKKALACAKKLIVEYRYVALLGSLNFYAETAQHDAFFEANPPTRVWFPSLRLPMLD